MLGARRTPKNSRTIASCVREVRWAPVPALKRYTERMVQEMDKMKCHATPARTESDQCYHNYLYDTGELAKLPGVRVTHHEQGHGIVNTIGAMNGFRVPKHMKGPLDTHWKIKDKDGWILDHNGERSAVVRQWHRFHRVRAATPFADDHMREAGGGLLKHACVVLGLFSAAACLVNVIRACEASVFIR